MATSFGPKLGLSSETAKQEIPLTLRYIKNISHVCEVKKSTKKYKSPKDVFKITVSYKTVLKHLLMLIQ
jgi:hypothetical protein